MPIDTLKIISRLYPQLNGRRRKVSRLKVILNRLREHRWSLVLAVVLILVWIGLHIGYYNYFVVLETNINKAWAQIENQQQRRFHIQNNVIRLVIGYSKHERNLLTSLTKLRMEAHGKMPLEKAPGDASGKGNGSAGPGAGADTNPNPNPLAALPDSMEKLEGLNPEQLQDMFRKIQVIAEQYPNLRLSENLQQVTKAIIDIEYHIARMVSDYNNQVNTYTTKLKQFPSSIFAKVCGFKMYTYYEPEKAKLEYRTVEYRGED